jgi:hypothetical protein
VAYAILQAAARNATPCNNLARLSVSGRYKAILLSFISYCDKTGVAWPSYITLAKQNSCSPRHVGRAFALFRKLGWIVSRRRWNTSSVHQLTDQFLRLIGCLKTTTTRTAAQIYALLGIAMKTSVFGLGLRARLAAWSKNKASSSPDDDGGGGKDTRRMKGSMQPQPGSGASSGSSPMPSYLRALLLRLKTEDVLKEKIKRK